MKTFSTRTTTALSLAAAAGLILCGLSQPASAADAGTKCESSKLKAQSKYTACRLKADATAVKKGVAADYAKCVEKITDAYTKAEEKAAGACPSVGDAAEVIAILDPWLGCTAAGAGGAGYGACVQYSPGGLPATGQTTAYGPGSDGAIRAGCAQSYTDNGDGTITDNCTGLMWEKKDDSGGLHDRDNVYTWSGASYGSTYIMDGTIQDFIDELNDVAGGGLSCFAGYCDWYVPNKNELITLVDNELPAGPKINTAFNQCPVACSDVTDPACSCTSSWLYWSATTYATNPSNAWHVNFLNGFTRNDNKTSVKPVRAVRAGS